MLDRFRSASVHALTRKMRHPHSMEPSMNRSALLILLATATAAVGAHANTYTDNARIVGVEAQYENVSVPRQECRAEWVSEARPVGGRNYGGAVVGGLAGALLGNPGGRGHGR